MEKIKKSGAHVIGAVGGEGQKSLLWEHDVNGAVCGIIRLVIETTTALFAMSENTTFIRLLGRKLKGCEVRPVKSTSPSFWKLLISMILIR